MSDLLMLFLGLGAMYALLYVTAVSVTLRAGYTVSPFNLPAVFREAIGALLRHVLNRTSLVWAAEHNALMDVLGLTPQKLTPQAVNDAVGTMMRHMKAHPWSYPRSQFKILVDEAERLMRHAQQAQAAREEARRRFDEAFQAAGTSKQRQVVPARPAVDWRSALGVNPGERDPDVIKKAYRKLAAKLHPDRGGDQAKFAIVSRAMDEARKELGFV